jgi:hypothetical protein
MEQSYINDIDIVGIYDNNANFSHKVYMYFDIDRVEEIGVAYDYWNRQLNEILGFANYTIVNDTIVEAPAGVFQSWVTSVSNIFPDSEDLTTSTRLMYVLLIFLLIDIIIFVVIFFILKSPKIVGWVILIFDILLFFYFLTIGYIPIAILIILLLLLIALIFLKIKGGN